MARIDNPIIRFSEENARRLHHPHDYALVISIQIGDYNTHRVLVDNGSLANILYYPAFQQMNIERERLIPTNAPLVRFGGTRVHSLGVVTISVTVSDYPQQITKDITFLVVDWSLAYNAILGRPTLNSWKDVTSTYHLMMKFPTEEHRTVAEPVERLEEVLLNDSKPKWTTKIGTLASPPVRQALISFLRENQDVFAWSHENMPGIDPSVIVHKLNISPSFPPVHQKKRVFAQERTAV
ncbi:uncharacterized protein LOC142608920 [Castanea sativa]|uniref:uncharacterized protein LOC142608920 n=1 Tax=Castanea sativa TaxID=21020 RepID=UPI003F649901